MAPRDPWKHRSRRRKGPPKRGGVHVRGYCRRPALSRMARKYRSDKSTPF